MNLRNNPPLSPRARQLIIARRFDIILLLLYQIHYNLLKFMQSAKLRERNTELVKYV